MLAVVTLAEEDTPEVLVGDGVTLAHRIDAERQGVQHPVPAVRRRDALLAVDAVHDREDDALLTDDASDAGDRLIELPVLHRDDDQVRGGRILRGVRRDGKTGTVHDHPVGRQLFAAGPVCDEEDRVTVEGKKEAAVDGAERSGADDGDLLDGLVHQVLAWEKF